MAVGKPGALSSRGLAGEPGAQASRGVPADLPTLVAIAAVACILANVLHEAVGHGGACLLEGGHPVLLTTVNLDCTLASRFVSAAGTLVNLIAGGAFWMLLGGAPARAARLRYFLWLGMAVNLMEGTGYFLYSGVSGIGDWADFITGFPAPWVWRAGLAILGGVSYFLVARLAAHELRPFLAGQTDRSARMRRARRLTFTPYIAGSALACFAGAFNPGGVYLEIISAAAASLGGMSGLLWMRSFLRGGPAEGAAPGAAAGLARSWGWMAGAAALVGLYVAILGPGIHFAAGAAR
ncbi:MAG TPA: hypothetical protein VGS20_08060 [Candidatus Acidoferrales bacterium]|nr:hypothetical protein [Candidatus Acidoferrales bacterium]